MISNDKYKIVIDSTPLVSIDFIIKDKDDKILLGKRTNKPAKGFYFTQGGRIFKNETIKEAVERLSLKELNAELNVVDLRFLGVYEHFYRDGMFDDVSTHYVNLAYEICLETLEHLPLEEHSEYRWFSLSELLSSEMVHPYVKDYFVKERNE